MGDTFCAFDREEHSDVFHGLLNKLHPMLKFTCEKENSAVWLILNDIRSNLVFLSSVYSKPTFTGLYTCDCFLLNNKT